MLDVKEKIKDISNFEFGRYIKEIRQEEWVSGARGYSGDMLRNNTQESF